MFCVLLLLEKKKLDKKLCIEAEGAARSPGLCPLSSFYFLLIVLFCVLFVQGSDSELKVEKDAVSGSDAKVDSGVPEVPVPPDDTPEVLNKALSGLSSR